MATRVASSDPDAIGGSRVPDSRSAAEQGIPPATGSRQLRPLALAAAAVGVVVGIALAADTEARVAVELPAPATWQTHPNGVNRRGEIGGFRTEGDGTARAIVWRSPESEPELLPLLEGDDRSWAGVINTRGVIPGSSGTRAVLWKRDGTVVDLTPGLPEFERSAAWVVSKRGVAAGEVTLAGTINRRAVVWSKKGVPSILPFDENVYHSTWAYSINDKGVVAGAATLLPNGRPYHAVYWTKRGEFVDLHGVVTEALPTAIASVAQDVLPNGHIVGIAWEPVVPGPDAPVQWAWLLDPRRGTVQVLDTGSSTAATAWVSAKKKQIAGYLGGDWLFDTYAIPELQPALWTRKKTRKQIEWVLTPIAIPEGRDGFAIWGMSDKGALVGVASDTDGPRRAYYVPPPRRKSKKSKR